LKVRSIDGVGILITGENDDENRLPFVEVLLLCIEFGSKASGSFSSRLIAASRIELSCSRDASFATFTFEE